MSCRNEEKNSYVAMGILLFGGPLLNPIIAAAAMSLSSVYVLLNALRLKGFKPVR
ncbi:hypothetical protein V7087_03410 [Neobacillus niacini]|uniref:hypothetical protein n=1 Tax=Neobacillus niacini TaxID=86668 RepID=UPI002FFFFE5C